MDNGRTDDGAWSDPGRLWEPSIGENGCGAGHVLSQSGLNVRDTHTLARPKAPSLVCVAVRGGGRSQHGPHPGPLDSAGLRARVGPGPQAGKTGS